MFKHEKHLIREVKVECPNYEYAKFYLNLSTPGQYFGDLKNPKAPTKVDAFYNF